MAFEHYDKCALLLPMDGANNGTVFTDWSPNPEVLTRFGDTITVTAQSKYYGSSGYFDGLGDYLSIAANSEFEFGDGDFTISAWIYLLTSKTTAGKYNCIFVKDVSVSTRGVLFFQSGDASGNVRVAIFSGSTGYAANGPVVPNVNEWVHVAAVRIGNDLKVAINGTFGAITDVTGVTVNPNSTYNQYIGTLVSATNSPTSSVDLNFHGYMQDVIVVKGAALWTANFTPPTRLIGELSNTNAAVPVENETGTPSQRTIIAMPRNYPSRVVSTVSDINGLFDLGRVPATEHCIIALHEGDPIKNDLIARVIPA